jgi:hypothetical protein
LPSAHSASRSPWRAGSKPSIDQRPDTLGGRSACRRQAALGERPQGDVVEGAHHQVGACPGQQLLVAESGDADRGHAPGLGGLDPAHGVLDHEAVAWWQPEFLRGGAENHRVGLAAREVPAGDVGVEQLLQGHPLMDEVVAEALLGGEGVEPDPFEEQCGVLRRGRRRDPDADVLDGQDEPQRVGEGHEPALLDELHDLLLLGGGVPLGPGLHVGHAEVLQGRAGARHPRLAGHHLLVHRRGEALRRPAGLVADLAPLGLHQHPERLAPGQLVGRVHQHAVHVEDPTLERHVPHPALSGSRSIAGCLIRWPRRAWPRWCRGAFGS